MIDDRDGSRENERDTERYKKKDRESKTTPYCQPNFMTIYVYIYIYIYIYIYAMNSISSRTFLYRHLQLSETLENSVCYCYISYERTD